MLLRARPLGAVPRTSPRPTTPPTLMPFKERPVKIIHTADWHLCDRLGPKIDRTADLQSRLERVATLCEEQGGDVLLIAGDLFSEQADGEQITDALKHVRETFKPFFARNGTVLAITGNHDRDRRINMVRAGMNLAAP